MESDRNGPYFLAKGMPFIKRESPTMNNKYLSFELQLQIVINEMNMLNESSHHKMQNFQLNMFLPPNNVPNYIYLLIIRDFQ